MAEINIAVPSEYISGIFGSFDENIKALEKETGTVILNRGDGVRISGDEAALGKAKKVMESLMKIARKGEPVTTQHIHYLLSLPEEEQSKDVGDLLSDVVCFTKAGKPIRPKTFGQKRYVNLIRNNMLTFGIGPAGTGKTYLAMAMAIEKFKKGEVSRLILTRPAIEAGERLGYLPGDLQSKIDPYLRPLYDALYEICPPSEMEKVVFTDDKMTREANVAEVRAAFEEKYGDNEEWMALIGDALYQYEKKTVRKMILVDHKRPDGREIKQIRPLAAEVDLIPRAHGSAMFTRGQTQICDVVTLAPLSDAQRIEGLDPYITEARYMHQYNFPSYSVGETKPSRGPGRREIGHGALAEKALIPVLPSREEFPYAIRAVSETFESNGSTSQASICASSMALMAAGVPIKKAVAGISCGLVTGETDDDYIVLTDIQGLEDFFGDMDFKVAGTHDGITAIQMDIKIHGLTRKIVEEAIRNTHEAREYILKNVMEPCIAAPRASVSKWAPKIVQIKIDPDKIGDVVGQKGKNINAIIAAYDVTIDIEDDGSVSICGQDMDKMDQAIETIRIITTEFEKGMILTGKVVSIKEFGAFLEFAPGKEAMVHISKIANTRINKVEDVLQIGDVVRAICLGKDKMGRISFSIKDCPKDPMDVGRVVASADPE